MNTPFPLTPALSLRERENPIQCVVKSGASVVPKDWIPFSLSPAEGERAGVRGNRASKFIPTHELNR